MKKKLTAALLTLCMVISLLPLSALAASWTAKFGSDAVTVTEAEDGTLSVVRDSDKQDLTQYYTFEKVTQGTVDTFRYYSLDGVHTGTLTEVHLLGVDGNETTVEADVENGTASTTVTVTDEEASGMVEAGAEEGTVKVTVSTSGASKVEVTLPNNLLTAAAEAEAITTVTVTTEVAVVALPTSAFANVTGQQAVKLTVTKMTTTTTILGGVSLDLSTGSEFKAPVAVTVKPQTAISDAQNVGVAYKKGDIWERINSFYDAAAKAFTFHTRHFSDFAIVDASASQPASIKAQTSGEYTLDVEANETLYAVISAKSGKAYIASSATADVPAADLRSANVGAPVADTDNVYVVVGKAQYTDVMGVKMVSPANGQASIMAVLNAD